MGTRSHREERWALSLSPERKGGGPLQMEGTGERLQLCWVPPLPPLSPQPHLMLRRGKASGPHHHITGLESCPHFLGTSCGRGENEEGRQNPHGPGS